MAARLWPRVSAGEIEAAVTARIEVLAGDEGILERLAQETNARLARQRPSLVARRRALQKSLDEVKAEADKMLSGWAELEKGRAFLTDRLVALAQRRGELEQGLAETEEALAGSTASG